MLTFRPNETYFPALYQHLVAIGRNCYETNSIKRKQLVIGLTIFVSQGRSQQCETSFSKISHVSFFFSLSLSLSFFLSRSLSLSFFLFSLSLWLSDGTAVETTFNPFPSLVLEDNFSVSDKTMFVNSPFSCSALSDCDQNLYFLVSHRYQIH